MSIMYINIQLKNLVAVITNGTAVLGLGDIGPEASKPVMEGKACCLKSLLILMFFDIEVDVKDIDKFIETVKRLPYFWWNKFRRY
jgi:malate dehydrogenase (oxaloacetate-decarboxylating)(NADP+)